MSRQPSFMCFIQTIFADWTVMDSPDAYSQSECFIHSFIRHSFIHSLQIGVYGRLAGNVCVIS